MVDLEKLKKLRRQVHKQNWRSLWKGLCSSLWNMVFLEWKRITTFSNNRFEKKNCTKIPSDSKCSFFFFSYLLIFSLYFFYLLQTSIWLHLDTPEHNTTKTCSHCGSEMKGDPSRRRRLRDGRSVPVRGIRHCNNAESCKGLLQWSRDHNAAINIRQNLIYWINHGSWDPRFYMSSESLGSLLELPSDTCA